ncbi:hypothetical protein OG21DRAFT_1481958 [Imleria badia]|nr:hypothetical protein OG21DRAFT_1481958 [Imleria badia]
MASLGGQAQVVNCGILSPLWLERSRGASERARATSATRISPGRTHTISRYLYLSWVTVPDTSNASPMRQNSNTSPMRPRHFRHLPDTFPASITPRMCPRHLKRFPSATPPTCTYLLQHVPYTSNASHMPVQIPHVGPAPILRRGSTLDLDEDLLVIEVDGDENLPQIQRQETLEARTRRGLLD